MIFNNNQQEKVLNHLAAVLRSVAGEESEYEDHGVSLSILDRALADALNTKVELLPLMDASLVEHLPMEVKAHIGRVLSLRAALLVEMGRVGEAVHSAELAGLAFRQSLSFRFAAEEDRYVAHYLHQLLRHPVAVHTFDDDYVGSCYTELFRFYGAARLLDRAEDMLFHALDLLGDPQDLLQEGLQFYDTLLAMDPRQLHRDGLPIQEVRAAHSELSDRMKRVHNE